MNIIEVRFLGDDNVFDMFYNIYGKRSYMMFFTKDMDSHIFDCKLDLSYKIDKSKIEEIIRRKAEEKKSHHYNKNCYMKMSLIYGDTIKVRLDTNGKIIDIYDLDPYVYYDQSRNEQLRELYNINKSFINIIKYCENNPIPLNNQIFSAGYEKFNKIKRTLVNLANAQDTEKKIKEHVKKFINKCDKEMEDAEKLFINMAKDIEECCITNEFGLKNHRLLNSKLYELKNHKLIFDKINELLLQLLRILDIDVKLVKYPQIKGKIVNISNKEIKKSSVKAHTRKTKMTKLQKEKVLCFLEENDLYTEDLGIITKDNFNTFDWSNKTIVEAFEKNIKGIKHQDNKDIEKYIDKEIEKQKKLDNANLIHQKLVRQMAYCIDKNGFEPKYNKFIDLYFEEDEICMIFEMKSINESNCYSQLMKAYSQLMVYPYICNIKNKVEKCIVLNQKPSERRFEDLFKDSNINLIWIEDGIFNTYEWSNDNVIKLLLKQVTITE